MNELEKVIKEFGKEIVIEARDYTLSNLERLFEGKSRGNDNVLFEKIKCLPPDVLCTIEQLIVDYIDEAIHDLFLKFNESLGKYKIITENEKGKFTNLTEESEEGLNYEYFNFIDSFSKYNSAYNFNEEIQNSWKLSKNSEN